ncbi:MAG: type sorting protein, partial [Ignavibacteria bacterium]|nr:type sorting protein [Ignavibacteria bacterium]
MKKLIILSLFLLLGFSIESVSKPITKGKSVKALKAVSTVKKLGHPSVSVQPVSKSYIEYLNKLAVQPEQYTSEGHSLGYIPPPFTYSTALPSKKYINKILIDLPSSYDLRNVGGTSYVTSVKNQSTCGACWTFATYGPIESAWLLQGYGTYDLSEQNARTCHGFVWGPCDGGNAQLASSYLTRIAGPISESNDPYNTSTTAQCTSTYTPQAYIKTAWFLPVRTDNGVATALKEAIYTYGGIYTAFNMTETSQFYNSTNHHYRYTGTSNANHAVTIVGWDDNMLITVNSTTSTGAWICKNSWGTSWGESGYFYIAYNDTRVNTETAVWPHRIPYNSNARIYRYDELGAIGWASYSQNTAYGKLIYTATADQKIIRLGSWAKSPGVQVTISVYSNSGLTNLLGSASFTASYAGYNTADLTTPITIANGSNFYLKVKYYTPGTDYSIIPVEMVASGYANPTIESNKCAISYNGTDWTDIGDQTANSKWDLCARVYSATPLAAPTLASPSDGATNVSPTATLSWNSVTNADGYALQVSTSSTFPAQSIIINNTPSTTSYSIPNGTLNCSTVYYWRAASRQDLLTGSWSSSRSFTTSGAASPSISGRTSGITEHDRITYTASTSGASYQWSVTSAGSIVGSSTGQSVSIQWTTPGSASFTLVISSGSCSGTTTQAITINPLYSSVSSDIISITIGSVKMCDYDRDGYLDLGIMGEDVNFEQFSKIYRNNSSTFEELNPDPGITGLYFGEIGWCDYDNDGQTDIAVCGIDFFNAYHTELYRNIGSGSFSQISQTFTPLAYGKIAWGDYDNDGDKDLLITGETSSSQFTTALYRNDGGGVFTKLSNNLPQVTNSSIHWADFNNDGKLDVVIAGYNGTSSVSKIFLGNGTSTFTEVNNTVLTGVSYASISVGDYDSDGYLDLVITGSVDFQNRYTKVYHNTGTGGIFENCNAEFTGVDFGKAIWGDVDNDGDLDLFVSGDYTGGEVPLSKIYYNEGSGNFASSQTSLTNLTYGGAEFGDYNNDNKIDLIINGKDVDLNPQTVLYSNNVYATNSAPTTPSSLTATLSGSSATLSWARSTDTETPQNGLSYNVYLGTSANSSSFISPMANVSTGFRTAPGLGNAFSRNFITINNLPSANFVWSVQAVDNGFKGSTFAASATFSTLPVLTTGTVSSSSFCAGANISIPFTISGIYESNNRFIAQLSNSAGSFASSNTIGYIDGASQGTINATIPSNQSSGSGYRIRVVSTNPAVNGSDNGNNLTINSLPTPSITGSTSICQSATETYSTSGSGVTNQWFVTGGTINSTTTNSVSITWGTGSTGVVTLIQTIVTTGCSNTATLSVSLITLPGSATGISASRCGSGSVTLSASGAITGEDYKWYSAATGGTLLQTGGSTFITPTLTTTTTYYVTRYNTTTNCESATRASAVATINSTLSEPVATGGSRCGSGSVTLSASGAQAGENYKWYSAPTGGTSLQTDGSTFATPTITTSTTFYVSKYNSNCESATRASAVAATVNPLPTPSISGNTSVCQSSTETYSTSGSGVTNQWSVSGGTINSTTTNSVSITWGTGSTGVVTLIQTIATTGCSNTATLSVSLITLPGSATGIAASRCGSGSVTLSASGAVTGEDYKWYSAATGGTLLQTGGSTFITPTLTTTTTYYVTRYNTTTNCESATRSSAIATINSTLSEPIATGGSRCGSGSVTLSASGAQAGENYKWYSAPSGGTPLQTDGSTFATPTITTSTTFYVSKYNSNCESATRASAVATVNPLPTPSITGNTSVCQSATGTYSTSGSGVTNEWFVTGGTINSTTTNSVSITWGTGSTGVVTLIQTIATTGCSNTATLSVTLIALPGSATGISASRCGSGSVTLSASGAVTGEDYKWYSALTGGTLLQTGGSTFISPTLTTTTTYYVTRYNTTTNCESATRSSAIATINSTLSEPVATGGSRCGSGSVTLSASGAQAGENYKWYSAPSGGTPLQTDGSTFATPTITTSTTFYVSKYNSNCESATRASAVATVNPLPIPSITGNSSICQSSTETYSTSGSGITNQWSVTGGTINSTTTNSVNITWGTGSTGVVTLIQTIATTGCSNTATLSVSLITLPGSATGISASRCGSGSVTLSASGAITGEDYKWYSAQTGGTLLQTGGSTFITPTLTTTTTYYVTRYNTTTNCESATRSSAVATINSTLSEPVATGGSRCGSGSVTLSVSGAQAGENYKWYSAPTGGTPLQTDGSTFATPTITTSTTFYVSKYNSNCESATRASAVATVNPLPTPSISGNTSVCQSSTETYSTSGSGVT